MAGQRVSNVSKQYHNRWGRFHSWVEFLCWKCIREAQGSNRAVVQQAATFDRASSSLVRCSQTSTRHTSRMSHRLAKIESNLDLLKLSGLPPCLHTF